MTWRTATAGQLLLIEDNPGDASFIIDLLEQTVAYQDKIVHVGTLSEALGRLQSLQVDAVLLDLGLPDASGVQCVTSIRNRVGEVAIVVLTGIDDEEIALSCIGAGAQDYISKQEVHVANLRRAIGYAIARVAETAERKRANALQERLAAIVEASSDAIVSTSPEGVITSWNRGAERIFGYSHAETIGRFVGDIIRPVDPNVSDDQNLRMLRVREGADSGEAQEIVRLRRDGRKVILSAVSSVLRNENNQVVGLAAICRDVTENKRRDEEIQKKNEQLFAHSLQLRALAARLNAVREEEQIRISRQVHDDLGQLLTVLKMDLRWIGRTLHKGHLVDAKVDAKLTEAEGLIDRTIETVQRIAVELRPSALDALGLAAAIRDEARRFEKRSGILTKVDIATAKQPESDVATTLFRIFQELVTNVVRHAQASHLTVILDDRDGVWSLRVEDDGIGIERGASDRATSLGLVGVNERAQLLGGTVTLERGNAGGTVAVVRIPKSSTEDRENALRSHRR